MDQLPCHPCVQPYIITSITSHTCTHTPTHLYADSNINYIHTRISHCACVLQPTALIRAPCHLRRTCTHTVRAHSHCSAPGPEGLLLQKNCPGQTDWVWTKSFVVGKLLWAAQVISGSGQDREHTHTHRSLRSPLHSCCRSLLGNAHSSAKVSSI